MAWAPLVKRAARRMIEDHMTLIAQACAFSAFLAVPSVLLVVVGVFTLVAGPGTIDHAVADLHEFIPRELRTLVRDGLHHLDDQPHESVLITLVGFVLALWSTTGAMTNYMTALDLAYHRTDRRSYLRRRIVALQLVGCLGLAFVLLGGLLIFGPVVERHVGRALGMQTGLGYLWWTLQWPILLAGLLAAFAALLYLGPDDDQRSFRLATPGALAAALVWLAASGLFALYTANFASYNKTWGSLSALIVALMWLWITSLALLFGAELDAEAEAERQKTNSPV